MVQNTLKYLLNFGQVSSYLGYSALKDFFPTMQMMPNPHCTNTLCLQRQKEYQDRPTPVEEAVEAEPEGPLHEENEWNITCDDDEGNEVPVEENSGAQEEESQLPQGLKFELPERTHIPEGELEQHAVKDSGDSVEDLMAQLAQAQQ